MSVDEGRMRDGETTTHAGKTHEPIPTKLVYTVVAGAVISAGVAVLVSMILRGAVS